MSAGPMTCPGCGDIAAPVERIFGKPSVQGLAALDRGDAVIAGGCTDVEGWQAPAQCRHCRRAVLPPGMSEPDTVAHVVRGACVAVEGVTGLWCAERGGALVWVVNVTSQSAAVTIPDAVARLLRSSRRPVVVVRSPDLPARIVADRAARAALAHDGFGIGRGRALAVQVGDAVYEARLQLPARRAARRS